MLNALSEYPIAFKGGTYLWFFQGLRRFSEDLDFTATGPLSESIPKYVSRALRLMGVENELRIEKNNDMTLSFRIAAKGPLNTGLKDLCYVSVDASKREKVLMKPIPFKLDIPAYGIPIKIIQGMALDEVASEKVRAILTRRKARDLYDLSYLIKYKKVKFSRDMVEEKLKYYDKKFDEDEFVNGIKSKESIYVNEMKPIIFGELPSFKSIYESIIKWID